MYAKSILTLTDYNPSLSSKNPLKSIECIGFAVENNIDQQNLVDIETTLKSFYSILSEDEEILVCIYQYQFPFQKYLLQLGIKWFREAQVSFVRLENPPCQTNINKVASRIFNTKNSIIRVEIAKRKTFQQPPSKELENLNYTTQV